MKERIEAIIQHERLTPSQFADSIGVQRSGVSHILSGRNKPSVDFLNKLLSKYPHISGDWLITGQGSMLSSPKISSQPTEQLSIPVLDEKPKTSFKMPSKKVREEEQAPYKTVASKEKAVAPSLPDRTDVKSIERIVVFYTDKSFSEYRPE